ncbi:MAG TPA: hypothetical protein VNO22_12795 [Planctomycetota bacterium]|jgi:hypothetical protein|nr:hypothetical protein [Planctomycetota bacterium]
MSDADSPTRRRTTTSIRKAQGAAPPEGGASAGRATGRLPAGRRPSAGERLQKTAKPPSRVGAAIKLLLILVVVLGIPGILGAGILIKDNRGRNVWVRLGQRFGLFADAGRRAPAGPAESEMDIKYKNALAARARAQFYVNNELSRSEKEIDSLSAEKLEEIVAELEKHRALVQQGIGDIEAVANEVNKPEGTTQSQVDNLQANEELQNQQKYYKELGALLVKWRDLRDRKLGRTPEPPKPAEAKPPGAPSAQAVAPKRGETVVAPLPGEAPKPPPPPAPRLQVPPRPHPWASFKPGAWVRTRLRTQSGDRAVETLTDVTLVELTDEAARLKVETLNPDGKVTVSEEKIPLAPGSLKALREEKLTIGGRDFACIVVETSGPSGPVRTWIPLEGRAARVATLKTESEGASEAAEEVGEETLQVASRPVACVTVQSAGRQGEKEIQSLVWYSEEIPGFSAKRVLKIDGARTTAEAIAFGDDAASKPALEAPKREPTAKPPAKAEPKPEPTPPPAPPEPPRPPEPPPAEVLARADALVKESSSLALRVIQAAGALPEAEDALRALLDTCERAIDGLGRAREAYRSVRDKASDPAAIDAGLGKIEKLLGILQNHRDAIKSKMK